MQRQNWTEYLKPGYGFKRRLALMIQGIALATIGAKFLVDSTSRFVPIPDRVKRTFTWGPEWLRGILFMLSGSAATYYAWRSLSHELAATLAPEHADDNLGLTDLFYERKRQAIGRRVVVIGSGTGLIPVVRAFLLMEEPVYVTVILTSHEGGHLVSLLRDELGLSGKQVIYPTGEHVSLWAELEDGTLLEGATAINQHDVRQKPIRRIFYSRNVRRIKVWEETRGHLTADVLAHYPPDVNPDALKAIQEAELVVIAPGRLYTDVLPTLTLPEIRRAVHHSGAKRVFVANIMTEPGKTDGFSVKDYLAILRQLAQVTVDYVIANDTPISQAVLEKYRLEGAEPVRLRDEETGISRLVFADTGEQTVLVEGAVLVTAPLITETPQLIPYRDPETGAIRMREMAIARHDPQRLKAVLAQLMQKELM